jgi:hypothetical protein
MWSYDHDRPNMALGGFTPKKHLAMAAWPFYFCRLVDDNYRGRLTTTMLAG